MLFALNLMTTGDKVLINNWNSKEQLNRKHLSTMRLSDIQRSKTVTNGEL
jgi:hypothetical protein